MLTHLQVRNLAIVDEVEVEPANGMTALTGETGAGKSILVDALALVLGDRADSNVIRHGTGRAEISAAFDVQSNATVEHWLAARDLDAGGECQMRRIISREGRSRGYINGQPAPMQSLRELGEQLVDIHGQHEHQSLLRSAVQRQLLDGFGGHQTLLASLAEIYTEWKAARDALDACLQDDSERDAKLDLLRYQLRELEALGMDAEEIRSVDAEHDRQAHAGQLLEASQQGLMRLDAEDGDSAYSLVARTQEELDELAAVDPGLEDAARLLGESGVLLQEGIQSLRRYTERIEVDPQRLEWLEQRIGVLQDLARKHRCGPDELPAIKAQLRSELDNIEHADQHREALTAKVDGLEKSYLASAKKLSTLRRKTARAFGKQVSEAMQTLGMAGGIFDVAVKPRDNDAFSREGMDRIEFQVSANKGQPLQPLGKVASGGELSRISLSIQVISAGGDAIPTLIFDEVDSGIGGGVAEIVGTKLRELGAKRQVLCVTHLPQVAALAHHQLQVTKLSGKDSTRIRIRALNETERIDELARMLGGVKITQQSRDHAREMIEQAGGKKPPRKKARRSSGG